MLGRGRIGIDDSVCGQHERKENLRAASRSNDAEKAVSAGLLNNLVRSDGGDDHTCGYQRSHAEGESDGGENRSDGDAHPFGF